MFRYLDLYEMKTVAYRWRFDMATGDCKEEQLSDRIMEFGMINGRIGGRRHRYSYNALPAKGWFGFEGVIKHDLEAGTEQVVKLPDGVYASETVMAPRIGSEARRRLSADVHHGHGREPLGMPGAGRGEPGRRPGRPHRAAGAHQLRHPRLLAFGDLTAAPARCGTRPRRVCRASRHR